MRSSFSGGRPPILATAKPLVDETYDLKGLNLVAPDQIMPKGETPYTINSRRYADNEAESSLAMRTRQGSVRLSTPVGEALDATNAGTVTGDLAIQPAIQVAFPFVAVANGSLTKFDLRIKKTTNTRGYVIIEIYDNNSGFPGNLMGQTSIAPSSITTSYANVSSYLIDAPTLVSGSTYWCVVKLQDLGVGTYHLAKTAGSGIKTTDDNKLTWTTVPSIAIRFNAYVSTTGFFKGFTKRYVESGTNLTMFGLGTGIYTVPNSPATATLLEASTDAAATYVRFAHVDDWTFYLDGLGNARRWDGTNAPSDIPNVPSALGAPINLLIMENRALFVPKNDPTRVDFSALYDFETYPSVNFFYIGRPKSPDPITAWHLFKTGATIFTKETKYTLTGSDIQTFIPTPHVGTKGAVSQEATALGTEGIYFMADDRHIYFWNGASDTRISFKVGPELKKILDVSKVRLHLYKNQLRVYYNRTPDSTVNHMLLYDVEQDQWFHDTGRPVMGSMEWTHDDNELVEFSSKAGALYFGERNYSDMGKAIDFKYWTAYLLYGSGAAKDRIKRFRPVVRPASSAYYMSIGKDINFQDRPDMRPWLVDGGGAAWGSFNWGDGTVYGSSKLVDTQAPMSGRGKETQYRFEHSGIEQPVQLYGYIALLKVGRVR